MEFRFEESLKKIQELEHVFNSIKYDHPQACAKKLAYVTALEHEFAELHKLCTETREEFAKRTTREVMDSLKNKR